jgi:hypothetical protein
VDWTDISDVSVPSFSVVEALDVVKDIGPGLSPRAVFATVDSLPLQQAQEAFH